MKIRLPLIAQPVLPRFVRPGDAFSAEIIGRLIEGAGGPGTAIATVHGVTLTGGASQAFTWSASHPAKLAFPVTVPKDAAGSVKLRFTLRRDADGAGDAVELDLPVQPDRPVIHDRVAATLPERGTTLIPPIAEPARPGTYSRSVVVAADPLLVRIVGGLQYLVQYPFGCTEQRIDLAASELALKPFAPILSAAGVNNRIAQDVASTLAEIAANTDADGLVAYWPHTNGSVLLTAWAFDFLIQAETAGLPVDKALHARLQKVLGQSLRSDYPRLFAPEAVRERVAALWALSEGGDPQPAYATELARRAGQFSTGSIAEIAAAIMKLPAGSHALIPALNDLIWQRVQTRLQDGQTVYAGLTDEPADPLILPSEAQSLSRVTRAIAITAPGETRLPLLRDGLMRIADGDGWGSTNATAAALRALAATWQKPREELPVNFALPGVNDRQGVISADTPLLQQTTGAAGPIAITVASNGNHLALLTDTNYVPVPLGSAARAAPHGFVIGRTFLRVPATGPMEQLQPGPGGAVQLKTGDVIEEVDEFVSPEAKTNVAITLPMAAGMEPLNPNLATSPANAAPSAGPTLPPDYASYGDDQVLVVYETLPSGTYTFRTRMRATIPGTYTAPPAAIQAMYHETTNGSSDGAGIVIAP